MVHRTLISVNNYVRNVNVNLKVLKPRPFEILVIWAPQMEPGGAVTGFNALLVSICHAHMTLGYQTVYPYTFIEVFKTS